MKLVRLFAAAVSGAATLAACGGGGGGSSPAPGPVAPANPVPAVTPGGEWLSLTPSPVVLAAYEGEDVAFSVTGKSSRMFEKPFNMAVIDTKGVISTDLRLDAVSQLEYIANLHTNASLAAGAHTTYIEVRLCEDAPLVCKSPLPGSPWYVPLTVNVKSRAESNDRVLVAPASVNLTTWQGEPLSFTLDANTGTTFSRGFNIAVVDKSGVIANDVTMSAVGSNQYKATLTTASVLAPGTYSTSLEVRVCADDPRVCASPFAGSPWRVPLTVVVKSNTNLTRLNTIPGVPSWGTYQGNASHTGFVPVTADPASFTRRWNIPETGTYEANGPAIDNGKVFLTRGSRFGAWKVMAISEDTGETAWSVDMGTLHEVNPPAAANGKLYVTSTGHQDTFFWVFDQATGALVSKVAMNSQWEKYLAPTVFGDAVYTNSGYYGGLSKFNAQSNALAWFTPLPQYDGWTPAVDGTYAYAYLAGELHAVKVTDGSVAIKIRNPDYSWHGYTGAAVVLGNKMGYVVDGGRLVGFDLANGTVAWSSNSSAMGQPALAGDTVYVIGSSGSSVEARATATGMLEWKSIPFAANGEFFENLVVTNNLAFASSPRQTVAIDLNTHAVVWTYPLGGQLSISARGVLYIASPTSKLAAVNLQ